MFAHYCVDPAPEARANDRLVLAGTGDASESRIPLVGIPDEGREALKLPPMELLSEAMRRYRAWRADREVDTAVNAPEVTTVAGEEVALATERAFVLEEAEDQARGEIEEFVRALGPYEFQERVAALLRGMGYTTSSPLLARTGARTS